MVHRQKYFGVTVVASINFTFDFLKARHKFLGSFNTKLNYGRVGNANSVSLLLSLLASICTPVLLFGTESSLGTTRRDTESICSAYNKAWSKKCHTYDKDVIFNCQYFCGYLPLEYQLDTRILIFFKFLSNYPDPCLAK